MSSDAGLQQRKLGAGTEADSSAKDFMVPRALEPRASYCTAYGMKLTDFLRNDYGMLRKYLGDIRFQDMAEGYIAANPSDQPNARWYTRNLPSYLIAVPQFAQRPEIAEMAQLENALNEAYDGPVSPVVKAEDLEAIAPPDFDSVRLELAPTLHRFSVTTNVSSIWASLRAGVLPPAPQTLDQPQDIMVWRQGTGARFRMLGKQEAIALDCARQSLPLRAVRSIIAAFDDGADSAERSACYLRGWLEAEIISSIRIDGETAK